jgi:hypothetical protein
VQVAIAPTDPGDDPFSATAAARPAPEDAADALAATGAAAPVGALDATVTPPGLGSTIASGATQRPASSRSGQSGDLATPITRTGAILGTPAYMAPEQLAGQPADARADQFAFCVTAWEAFTGERPFRGKSFAELVAAVDANKPEGGAAIPRRLRPVLLRGLERTVDARWPSMDVLLATIERAWHRPRRLAIAGGALATVAGAVVAVGLLGGGGAATVAACADPDVELAPAWSPSIRAAFAKSMGTAVGATDALRHYDRWAEQWKRTQVATCAAPKDPAFALRRRCLASVRDGVALTMEHVDLIKPEMYEVPDIPRLIAQPGPCFERAVPEPPVPTDPAVRREVSRIRVELASARAPILLRKPTALTLDLTDELAAAKVTGYAPVITEAEIMATLVETMHADDIRYACEKYAAIANRAADADYPRMAVEALLLQRDCLDGIDGDEDEVAQLDDRIETLVKRTQNPIQLAELGVNRIEILEGEGRYTEALTRLEELAAIWRDLGIPDGERNVAMRRARILLARHASGDVEHAIDITRGLLLASLNQLEVASMTTLLRAGLWRAGRMAEAPPFTPEELAPVIKDPIEVTIEVTDGGAPVAGAEIAAVVDLRADATRIAMPELDKGVTGVSGADGRAALVVDRLATILVRKGDRVGWAAAPAKPGKVGVALGPSATLSGRVDGNAGVLEDPNDVAARSLRRTIGQVTAHAAIGGRAAVWITPVAADGSWRLPGLVPATYRVAVRARSPNNDHHERIATVTVRAGENVAPAFAFPAPHVVEVVVQPIVRAEVIAMPAAGAPPKTWSEITARVKAAPWITMALLDRARTADQAKDALIGRLATDGGAVVVCAMPGAGMFTEWPVWDFSTGPDATPPMCQNIDANEPVARATLTLMK